MAEGSSIPLTGIGEGSDDFDFVVSPPEVEGQERERPTCEGIGEGSDDFDFVVSPPEVEGQERERPTCELDLKPVKQEVTIVLAGKSGAGKSTLAKNLLGKLVPIQVSPDPLTSTCHTEEGTKHGVTVKVVDTVGLQQETREERRRELKILADYVKDREVDCLIYCLPVAGSSKFSDRNPNAIKSLHAVFGRKIWEKCIIVFTFSNQLWSWIDDNISNRSDAIKEYNQHLRDNAERFKTELKKLGVDNDVKLLVDCQSNPESSIEGTIIGIPAGGKLKHDVLLDFKYNYTITQDIPDPRKFTWADVIFFEIVAKCKCQAQKNLLQYRYGERIARAVVSTLASGVSFAIAGAGVGAGIGTVAGPLGVVIAAPIGGVIGFAIGAVIGHNVLDLL